MLWRGFGRKCFCPSGASTLEFARVGLGLGRGSSSSIFCFRPRLQGNSPAQAYQFLELPLHYPARFGMKNGEFLGNFILQLIGCSVSRMLLFKDNNTPYCLDVLLAFYAVTTVLYWCGLSTC